MPTGYTHKLCNGTQTSFKEFATGCMRAFAACTHIKDAPTDKEYEPMIASDYHKKALVEARQEMAKLSMTSDSSLLYQKREEIKNSITHCIEPIAEALIVKNRLVDMQCKVNAWMPPTADHYNFKKFMLRQLQITISSDGQSYREKDLLGLREINLDEIDPSEIRAEKTKEIQRSIDYHAKKYEETLQNVISKNLWVTQLLESLKGIT